MTNWRIQRCATVLSFACTVLVVTQLAATGKAQSSENRGFTKTTDQKLLPKGKGYALLFATDAYADPAWRPLKNPRHDANTIASELSRTYGFAEARVLENPTLSQIRDTLYEYVTRRKFNDNDQLFIFFAGHGLFRTELDHGYVVASDSKAPDVDRTNSSYLSYAELYRLVNSIPVHHTFLVLDVCHGGTFAEAMTMRGETRRSDYDELTGPERISRILERTTRKFLTSGGDEYVPDGTGAHSPFAAKFIEALRTPGDDRLITASEIYQVVRYVRPNTPVFGDFGKFEPVSDFIFVAKPQTEQATAAVAKPEAVESPSATRLSVLANEWGAAELKVPREGTYRVVLIKAGYEETKYEIQVRRQAGVRIVAFMKPIGFEHPDHIEFPPEITYDGQPLTIAIQAHEATTLGTPVGFVQVRATHLR